MSKSLESSGKDVIELKGYVPCDSRAIIDWAKGTDKVIVD
jgi:hypothetical protein